MEESKNREMKQLSRDLRKINGGNALNFLFLLDQSLKKFEPSTQKVLEKIAETIMLCVDKFAPVKKSTVKKLSNDWINNKLKNEITKINKLFQNCLKCPTEKNRSIYKNQRNIVTKLIKNSKRQSNYDKLGRNPSAKMIYRNMKSYRRHDQPAVNLPKLEKINQFFTTIGPKLASSISPAQHKYDVDKIEKSMVLNYTNELEVSKIIASSKNKKSSGHGGISNEIFKCCSPIILTTALKNSFFLDL